MRDMVAQLLGNMAASQRPLGTHAQAAVEEFAAEGAVTTYVGKRGAAKAFQQAEIDKLLVDHCLQVPYYPLGHCSWGPRLFAIIESWEGGLM